MFLLEVGNLKENFARYFSVEAAVSETLKHEVFRVRHAVYCQELGYEPTNTTHEETDAFDARALHIALRAQSSGRIVGCARLVHVDPAAPDTPLPFETLCADAINRSLIDPAKVDRRHIVEISRLAVLSDYRKRKGDSAGPIAISEEDMGTRDQPRFPYIPVGLYLGLLASAELHGVEHMFTLTEARLARHLSALGFRIHLIGSPVEHRGKRVPSVIYREEVMTHLPPFMLPLFDQIRNDMARQYAQTPA
ncbi:MAG: PEP-CTERM/exosortase system-associated acyltransferase [Gammaproteobacteria bacterium]|jgi:N-acyl amino acid synthase of PEP-CTERM/exosortase system|nr:PEP-CTERM/exosortase system-associated acyltransferase [Gammaproteobacteria bacterium]MBU0770613.1 PEP-CTERM/exosortase system-associated acyltransferase [Gammaproteobacteria bacterium]MBU0856185.1 PEP-CTERM/exosortase system-associated acyltransferase [Gammaproteobacteria bacterium]MBU1845628.1 PEP-CTERM/exosortase system-associated acyltransferase [Gammaproteobacteria bacterium]